MARKRSRLGTVGMWVGIGITAATLAQELRKPAAERTWHGDVYGIPYDYRKPTVDKVVSNLWDPNDERILKPRVFGWGWDVNLGRLVQLVSESLSGSVHQPSVQAYDQGGRSSFAASRDADPDADDRDDRDDRDRDDPDAPDRPGSAETSGDTAGAESSDASTPSSPTPRAARTTRTAKTARTSRPARTTKATPSRPE